MTMPKAASPIVVAILRVDVMLGDLRVHMPNDIMALANGKALKHCANLLVVCQSLKKPFMPKISKVMLDFGHLDGLLCGIGLPFPDLHVALHTAH
jgi:hypothetical protein